MKPLAVDVLVSLAVFFVWLSLFGLLVMRNVYGRLHALAPAALVPPILLAVAVALESGFSANTLKSCIVLLLLLLSGPLLTHAIGRAARLQEKGQLTPND